MFKNSSGDLILRLFVAVCLTIPEAASIAFAETSGGALSITLVESVKDTPDGRREILVRVMDGSLPVTGADVVFTMPESGAGGLFSNGSRTVTVQTDQQGWASSGRIQTNRIPGRFEVAVAASLAGETAQANVPQSNQTANTSSRARRALKWILIGAAAAGAAVAIVLARGDGAEPVVTVGPPTVGNPQ